MMLSKSLRVEDWPSFLRFVYYLVSGIRLTSYESWKRDGEPNPFVPVRVRLRQTYRQEILDIFDESLERR